MKKDLLVIGGLAGLVVVLLVAGGLLRIFPTGETETAKTQVRIRQTTFTVDVADTAEKRGQGLSGVTNLPGDSGMLFVFEKDDRFDFWMKDMKIPIDIIWIAADKTIADITLNVQPEPGKSGIQLRIYKPAVPVRYILEVAANTARRNNFRIGDSVFFQLP